MVRVFYREKSGIGENFGDLTVVEEQFYQNYPLNYEPRNLKDFKKILKELIKNAESSRLKIGLEIILDLISHPKKEVVASALGNLFPLINDESIQKLIVKELREMAHDPNPAFRESALYSLDLIAGEVYKIELFEVFFALFSNLSNMVYFGIKNLRIYSTSFYLFNILCSSIKSLMRSTVSLLNHNHLYYNLQDNALMISDHVELFLTSDRSKDSDEENSIDEMIIPFSDIINVEYTDEDSLNTLATIYAQTFLENGHLRRLEALLDDESYRVRQMGIDGLIYAVNILISFEGNSLF